VKSSTSSTPNKCFCYGEVGHLSYNCPKYPN
jgi:hypothetical protein